MHLSRLRGKRRSCQLESQILAPLGTLQAVTDWGSLTLLASPFQKPHLVARYQIDPTDLLEKMAPKSVCAGGYL